MVAAVVGADHVRLRALLADNKPGPVALRVVLGAAAARVDVRSVALLLDANAEPDLEQDNLDPVGAENSVTSCDLHIFV